MKNPSGNQTTVAHLCNGYSYDLEETSRFYSAFHPIPQYITLAASACVDVKTLQSIAGHSDIKMTLEKYAHARKKKVIEAGKQISSVLRTCDTVCGRRRKTQKRAL